MDLIEKIINELSLWKPQKLALRKLNSTIQNIDLTQDTDTIKASLPGNLSFDTMFPSFTFDMATGTGKTRLMAACLYYLYKKEISRNFFLLCPGETIYRKTIDNFTKGHAKFEFSGWSDLPQYELITGENYEKYNPSQSKLYPNQFTIFIFNIDKFRRKDKESLKFHKFREALGASFGELISQLDDLVLLMDESHHYRAEITKVAIEGLKPVLGLEFTATPVYKKNIVYSYSLGNAVIDGLIKRMEAIIRKNDRSYEDELEELKLLDGFEIHKRKKVYLEEYCKNNNRPLIKSIVFISTKNIAHGKFIQEKIESDKFMDGEFRGKTIYVHSGSEDEQIHELLKLEEPGNTKEVVIHVNKLKEGWDIKTIYTIIPLRASISEILVEQTIGRGVRLPFYDVTKEEIENNLKAFTLSVLTYKTKGDNYKDIINAASKNNIIVKDYDLDEDKGKNLIPYEIRPVNKKFNIKIPKIEGKISVSGKLKPFDMTPKYEDLKKELKTELESIDLTEKKQEVIAEAAETFISDQFSYIIARLVDSVDELDFRDKPVVEKLVEVYLTKAADSKNRDEWEKLLKMHRRYIFEDIKNQIQQKISGMINVKYETGYEDFFEFTPYTTSIDREDGIKDKDNILDEEIKRTVVQGYKKSVFIENKFHSKQEKWFADILDKDSEVKKWIKNPNYQIAIKYKSGSYYPDFIIETKEGNFVIEIKGSRDIAEPTVIEKAKEAQRWVSELTKITKQKWQYKLISHDKVVRTDSFSAIISTALEMR
jgi:restriction endonuclease